MSKMSDEDIKEQMERTAEAHKEFKAAQWYSKKLRKDRDALKTSLLTQASSSPQPTEPRRCHYSLCERPLKIAADFYKDRRSKDGLDYYCKECRKALSKNWKTKNANYPTAYSSKRRQTEAYIRQLLAHILIMDPTQHYRIPVPPPHLCLDVDHWLKRLKEQEEATRKENYT